MNEHLPEDIHEELTRLRRKSKIVTWLFGSAVGVLVLAGAFLYLQQSNLLPGPLSKGSVGYGVKAYGVTNQSGSFGAGGSSSGGCGGCGSGAGQSVDNKELEKQALDAYNKKFGKTGPAAVSVKITDFGCHIQADLYGADNKIIKSYAYRGGQLSLIS